MPRPLTADLRRRLGLPEVDATPYRWTFALLVVSVAAAPLLLAGWIWPSVALVSAGLLLVPAVRWFERKEALEREEVYTHGSEAFGHIIAVEPPGPRNPDRRVLVEFWAEGARIETAVNGCRLARQGLAPGEEVRVVYSPNLPTRCLIVERARRQIVDAV